MRVLYITIEFTNTFSGNGRFSQAAVRALLHAGHDVCVLCACPEGKPDELSTWSTGGAQGVQFCGFSVPVSVWNRTDRLCGWEEFGRVPADVCAGIVSFAPTIVVGVDWTSAGAYRAVLQGGLSVGVPFVYYNYRVYFNQSNNTEEDTAFYREQEKAVFELSQQKCFVCLSRTDRDLLQELCGTTPLMVLPPLRADLQIKAEAARARGEQNEEGGVGPKYLLSCTRIARDKNTLAFAEIVEFLAPTLKQVGIVPCVVGAIGDADYAAEMYERLQKACPEAVIHQHMGTDQFCEVLSRTVVNVHPAIYEAYGMTIAEAAAFGVPSVVNGGAVGATDLLREDECEVIAVDMEETHLVAHLLKIFLSKPEGLAKLREVGEKARQRSLTYTERQCGEALAAILETNIATAAEKA